MLVAGLHAAASTYPHMRVALAQGGQHSAQEVDAFAVDQATERDDGDALVGAPPCGVWPEQRCIHSCRQMVTTMPLFTEQARGCGTQCERADRPAVQGASESVYMKCNNVKFQPTVGYD
jgi:hypothetical protein